MPMSTRGRSPAMAAPAAIPQKPSSAMGGDLIRLAIFLAQTRKSRLAGSRADQAAADQHHAPVLFHDFVQRADEGLSKSHFLRPWLNYLFLHKQS